MARHLGKQSLAPQRHALARCWYDGRAAQQKPRLQRFQCQTAQLTTLQRLRYVGAIHEPKIVDHAIESMTERANVDPLGWRHPRFLTNDHREQHDLLVQYAVASEVAQQRTRNGIRVASHEYRGSGYSDWRMSDQRAE